VDLVDFTVEIIIWCTALWTNVWYQTLRKHVLIMKFPQYCFSEHTRVGLLSYTDKHTHTHRERKTAKFRQKCLFPNLIPVQVVTNKERWSEAHRVSSSMNAADSFYSGSGQGMKLTLYFHLVPRLSMREAMTSLPLMPSWHAGKIEPFNLSRNLSLFMKIDGSYLVRNICWIYP